MSSHLPEARSVAWAGRVFERSLRMLPPDVYAGYAREMSADFRVLVARAHVRWGVAGVCFVLLRGCLDLLLRAVLERRRMNAVDYVSDRAKLPVGERMSIMGQELRQAARAIVKRPGFTFVTVLTLALGIGANVAIFAVVNAVLIRPLPFPESERVVWIRHHAPGVDLPDLENSMGTLRLYRTYAKSFSDLGALVVRSANLTGGQEPARISLMQATASFFDVLRLQPMLGRRFVESDAARGAPPVALLTYRGWRNHFGSDRSVIGRTIQADGVTREVVGVLPKSFAHPDPEIDVVVPMAFDPNGVFGAFGEWGIARLKPGVTLAAAQAEVTSLQPRLTELFPDLTADFLKKAGWSASVLTMRDHLVRDAETMLWVVLGTVCFLLLVACASVANLFLVRAEGRHREVGVRLALGGTRARIAGTFLSESLLLGLGGGFWGLLLAVLGVRALMAAGPQQLPRLQEVSVDARVVLFALGISLVAGIVFGILPLPQQLRRPLHGLARESRGQIGTRERQPIRKALIIAQIALAVVLVTGSGLMLRSFQRVRAINPGIQPDGVMTLGVSLDRSIEKNQAAATYQRILDELRRLPGVEFAAATNGLPLDPGSINGGSFRIQSKPRAEDELPPIAMYTAISDDYLKTIGTLLVQGRTIERADQEQGRNVVLVNQAFARQYLANRALGERIGFADDSAHWFEVVGVIADVRTFDLRQDVRPFAYLPLNAVVDGMRIGNLNIVLRTTGDPLSLVTPARAVIRRINPNIPVTTARTMEQVVQDSEARASFAMTILLIASLVALLLGSIGLYGVINYVVTQRTSEIGVRMALGAIPNQVRRLVLSQGLRLGVAGVTIGLLGAIAVTRVLESLLFEVKSRDPLTFVIVPAIMLGVTFLAAYLPARRASSVSPLQALRAD